MGHAYSYYEVEVEKGKKGQDEIAFLAEEEAEMNSDSGGLPGVIRWIDVLYENYEEAEKAIEKHDRGWYDQLAVKYKKYEPAKKTKMIEQLESRISSELLSLENYKRDNSVSLRKSNLVTCKKCSSRVNKEYIVDLHDHHMWNKCPVCQNDLSSNTVKKTIESKEEKISGLRASLKKAVQENEEKGKYKEMWLVKIEYHI